MSHRVLVIEDNVQNMYLISYLLKHAGMEVLQATDGRSGLELVRAERPDLIVLDIQLPELDGYEVARRLAADDTTAEIPVVAVTSHAMSGDREKILAAGCNGYIEKPIDPDSFASLVADHLRSSRMGGEA
ncbi:MAG: two-component system response regulator [Deltaproteobacteria bacterium]|nr:MAG: two-component system response regulator [Pseudomonadota bacterium]PIE66249.1 MAG: two-component system response regulator [Deltaproteobacteria bacterium]